MTSDIDVIRAHIDALDTQIVELIAQRQDRVVAAGQLKADAAAVRDPDRVQEVIARVRTLAQEHGATPDVVEQTYRAMINALIEVELTVHQRSTVEP